MMACHLSGVPTAVATCGTSFGEDHVKILRRLIHGQPTGGDLARSSSPSTATRPGRRPRCGRSPWRRSSSPRPTSRSSPTASTRATCGCQARSDAAVRDLVARRGAPLFELPIKSVLAKHDLDTREGASSPRSTRPLGVIVEIKDQAKWRAVRGSTSTAGSSSWTSLHVLDRVRQAAAAMQPKRGAPVRSENRSEQGTPTSQHRQANPRQTGEPRHDQSDPVHRVEQEALQARRAVVGAEPGRSSTPSARRRSRCPPTRPCSSSSSPAAGWGRRAGPGTGRRPCSRRRRTTWSMGFRDRAGGGAAPGVGRAGREVRRRRARPGRRAGGKWGRSPGSRPKLQRMNPEEDQAAYGRVFGELVGLEQRRRVAQLDQASGA